MNNDMHWNKKNETDTEKTIYYTSRGLVILAIFQYRNNSFNGGQYIAFCRAYLVIILKALI